MGAAIQLPFVEHTVPSAASSDDRESQSGALDWQGATLSFEVHGNQMHHSIWSLGHRFGEAQHPGPHQSLVLGCTNGGLRNKEALAVAQGPGIWTYSETHLSSITQVSSGKALKHAARQENRLLRPFFSAPAPLRSRSDWAGTWTGVVCTSDFCSKQLQVEWPPDLWNSGRVLATQHQIGTHSITVVSLYGLPRGPTWPRAATIMNDILAFISKTFVFGHSGLVAICGDFNFSPHELEHFNIWRSAGWCSAQELATTRWDHVWTPTCKGATERDIIWLSPAAASLCTGLHIEDVFCDHSSISVTLDLAEAPTTVLTWPRPQEINWEQVDVAGWHAHCSDCTMEVDPDSTVHMTNFAQHFENSLNGYVGQPGSDLQSAQKGRSKRLKPAKQTLQPTTCRASRPGEVALTQDLVGTAVLQWFRQLRRIQSYCHSIKAGRLHNEAVVYRAELWTSIKRASGFQHGFAYWWDQQEFFHAVGPLPLHPPGAAIAKMIYEAFHHAFRAFERWHLAQKNRLIQTKYEKATQAIFKDLRDPSPDQIDSLWTSKAYQVIAVREESKAVLLDDGIRPLPGSTWYHNGCGLTVDGYIDEMLVFKQWPNLAVGDVLTQASHTSSDAQVHEQLIDLWKPRWQQLHAVDPDHWSRITGFIQSYMPSFDFVLPDITLDQWMRTVKRFKPNAARGADGFAKRDLLNMSRMHVNWLLQFLMRIELEDLEWPQQLQQGLVLAIAKHSGAHEPGSYRPIVLFSIIYRCWGSLRSRQLLRAIENFVHSDALGFLPGREAMQSWLQIQASVELALNTGQAVSGLAVDFVKAFNNIRRPQWFELAKHLGLPQRILRPWQRFLSSFTRRFQVHNHLSLPLTSDVGFAEGDPLSVPAMAILDWALHVYQSQYAPLTRTMSFVDNISMLSRQIMTLVWAFFSLHAFLELWGLEIDLDKSYSWSTTPQTRAQLAPLGLRVVEDVSELGGSLTFSSAARVRIFLKRGAKLEQKWARLRISKAPLAQKLMVLPMVFWASALHGALGCIFAESHLHHLRKKAVAALGLKTGGSNPLLRLTLAQPHTADPGFYHLRHCIFDFRRICSKTPDLTVQWRQFMRLYSGRKLPGPFYKIVELFSQIGWSIVVPPFFTDHDGFVHNLYDVPNSTLDALLFDAWLQHVAVQVQHRRTMHDLCGIDPELTLLDRAHMTALELGRTMALQCGAFLSDWHQAKFDPAKQQICQLCLVPNTQRHWFVCPHFDNVRTEIMEPFNWISEIPDCTVSHLLVPRNPYAVEFKSYFLSLEDATGSFHSEPGEGLQNLFSDGSFFPGIPKIAGVGAWSLVNATSGQVIGAGPLHGLTQSIARAELCGALAAIKWVAHFQTMACLWCDSKHVVDGLQALLDGRWTTQDSICENHDLWQQAEAMLADIPDGHFQVNWTPSHLDFVQCESTWEEWLATWNAIADSLAVSVNEARSYEYNDLQYKAQQRFAFWSERLRLIRKFFWTVADSKARDEEVIDLTASEAFEWPQLGIDLAVSDAMPINWQTQLKSHLVQMKYPIEFVFAIFDIIFSFESPAVDLAPVGFVELTIWCIRETPITFPFWNPSTHSWDLKRYHDVLLKPTLASVCQVVRHVLTKSLHIMGLEHYLLKGFRKPEAGFTLPLDGIACCTNHTVLSKLASCSMAVAGQTKFRKSSDLARPI